MLQIFQVALKFDNYNYLWNIFYKIIFSNYFKFYVYFNVVVKTTVLY